VVTADIKVGVRWSRVVLALRACVEVAAKSKSSDRVTSRKACAVMTVAQCPTEESTE